MAGLLAMPGGAAYSTSKHAVVGLSKSLRIEAADPRNQTPDTGARSTIASLGSVLENGDSGDALL